MGIEHKIGLCNLNQQQPILEKASYISIYFQLYKFYLTNQNKLSPSNPTPMKLQVIQKKKHIVMNI